MKKNLEYTIISFASLIALMAIIWWIMSDPTKEFSVNTPGQDNRNSPGSAITENIKIGEVFTRFDRKKSDLTDKWPRFRGTDFDNMYKPDIELINQFNPDPPPVLWSVGLGEGHAGPAIYNGKVYILDYMEEEKADMLRCFSLQEGTELWRRGYSVHVKRNHGMSRTVPAVTEDFILTIGPRCHVMCVERESGDFLWGIDVEKEYESEIPLWYTGQCPLIDQGNAIIATGGKALLIAVDCKTGEKIWETPNPMKWKMSHSSVIPFEYMGQKMYVYSAVGGVCGISAEGKDAGKILWQTTAWNHSVVAPSPVCMPDGKIFITAGYGAGSMVLQLSKNDNQFTVQVVDEYKPNEGLACEQQTPIYYNKHLFGILPKDAGSLRNQFVCVHPDNCREIVWSSGKTKRFGLGPYIFADQKFYLLNDDGTLFIIDANTQEYIEYDHAKIIDGHDAWAPLAIADGYMILRDANTMVCINIKT